MGFFYNIRRIGAVLKITIGILFRRRIYWDTRRETVLGITIGILFCRGEFWDTGRIETVFAMVTGVLFWRGIRYVIKWDCLEGGFRILVLWGDVSRYARNIETELDVATGILFCLVIRKLRLCWRSSFCRGPFCCSCIWFYFTSHFMWRHMDAQVV